MLAACVSCAFAFCTLAIFFTTWLIAAQANAEFMFFATCTLAQLIAMFFATCTLARHIATNFPAMLRVALNAICIAYSMLAQIFAT